MTSSSAAPSAPASSQVSSPSSLIPRSSLPSKRIAMAASVGNHSTNILPAQDPMFVPPRGEGRVTHAPGSGPGVLPPDGGVPDRVAADARPPVPAAAGAPPAPPAPPAQPPPAARPAAAGPRADAGRSPPPARLPAGGGGGAARAPPPVAARPAAPRRGGHRPGAPTRPGRPRRRRGRRRAPRRWGTAGPHDTGSPPR